MASTFCKLSWLSAVPLTDPCPPGYEYEYLHLHLPCVVEFSRIVKN